MESAVKARKVKALKAVGGTQARGGILTVFELSRNPSEGVWAPNVEKKEEEKGDGGRRSSSLRFW